MDVGQMSGPYRKTVVCLLHIPKTAGSSVWHTVVTLPYNGRRQEIGFADTYYEARRILNTEDPLRVKREAVVQFNRIMDEFSKSALNILFVHHHTPGLPAIRSEFDYDFICVVRNPKERLESALRHWLGGIMDKKLILDSVVDLTDAVGDLVRRGGIVKRSIFVRSCVRRVLTGAWIGMPFEFFGSFVSYGVDSYMNESFGPKWQNRTNCGMPRNARSFIFDTNDLHDCGIFVEWFADRYGVNRFSIPRFNGTVTERGRFYVAQQQLTTSMPGFRGLFKWKIRMERGAVKHLLGQYRPNR